MANNEDQNNWPGPRINYNQFTARLAARRMAAGPLPTPRNPGTDRTESKKAMLKAIADLGGKW